MAHLEVTCITKRPGHYNPHERIEKLGGVGWYKDESEVIADIERGANSYCVSAGGRIVQLVVSTSQGRKYLKTLADDYAPNNLLALPECNR